MKNKFSTFYMATTAFMLSLFVVSLFNFEEPKKGNNIINLDEDFNTNIKASAFAPDIYKEKESNYNDLNVENESTEKKIEIRPILFKWPANGYITLGFNPDKLVYDEILDQYRTSNGVYLETTDTELVSMCDGKIESISKTSDLRCMIDIVTTENHKITLKGNFDNISYNEGDIVLKGNKICDIIKYDGVSVIEIITSKDDIIINPESLI